MFTGIVAAIGAVRNVESVGGDLRLGVHAGSLDLAEVAVGHSIAVAGVCLTVTAVDAAGFTADVSQETVRCTTLGELTVGRRVNLEKALRAGDPLGGHYVTGHVDGIARVLALADEGRSLRVTFALPEPLARYVAAKGAVTVDGTSLTVNEIGPGKFTVNLVPHTRSATTLGALTRGDGVNVEVDILSRYLERLSEARGV